jgi:hypothetical protein
MKNGASLSRLFYGMQVLTDSFCKLLSLLPSAQKEGCRSVSLAGLELAIEVMQSLN